MKNSQSTCKNKNESWDLSLLRRRMKKERIEIYRERERNLLYYNQTHAIKNRNNITINQGLYSKLHILYLCLTHILSFAIRIELLPFVQYFFIFSSSFITQQKFFCFSDDYEILFATKLCIDDISHKIAAFHYQMKKNDLFLPLVSLIFIGTYHTNRTHGNESIWWMYSIDYNSNQIHSPNSTVTCEMT